MKREEEGEEKVAELVEVAVVEVEEKRELIKGGSEKR